MPNRGIHARLGVLTVLAAAITTVCASGATFTISPPAFCQFSQSLSASPTSVAVGDPFILSWCDPSYFNGPDASFFVSAYRVYYSRSPDASAAFLLEVRAPNTSVRLTATSNDIGTLYLYVTAVGCRTTTEGGCPPNPVMELPSNTVTVGVGKAELCPFAQSLSTAPTTVPFGEPFLLRWCDPSFTTMGDSLRIAFFSVLSASSPAGPFTSLGSVTAPRTIVQLVPNGGDDGVNYFRIDAFGCRGPSPVAPCTTPIKQLESNLAVETITKIFSASPTSIGAGQTSTLSWSTQPGTAVTIDNGVGAQASTASVSVTPAHTTTYTLTATNAFGTASDSVTVEVITASRIVIVAFPRGLVQTVGTGGATDSFTVANVGGAAGSISLIPRGDFFSVAPTAVTLPPGGRASFTITATAQTAGAFLGDVVVVKPDTQFFIVPVTLLSATPPLGSVAAKPTEFRTFVIPPEIVTSPAIPGIYDAFAEFTNSGTDTLQATVVADVPWIFPAGGLISIPPGQSKRVVFSVDPSQVPPVTVGSAAGTLSLNYLGGRSNSVEAGGAVRQSAAIPVVHTTRTQVISGAIPAIAPGQFAYVIPGLPHFGTLVGELLAQHRCSSNKPTDVSLYYLGPAAESSSSLVAPFAGLPQSTLLDLSDVVSFFGDFTQFGTVQIRATNPADLSVVSNLIQSGNARGLLGSVLPAIRSDRGSTKWVLTGVRGDNSATTSVYVQEVSGINTTVRTDYLDASGAVLVTRSDDIGPFASLEERNSVPVGGVTVVISVTSGGNIVARGLVTQSAGGDVTDVLDWSARNAIRPLERVVIPYASRQQTPYGPMRTELVAFNSEAVPMTASLTFYSASPGRRRAVRSASNSTSRYSAVANGLPYTLTLAPRETRILSDLLGEMGVPDGRSGYLVISPVNGPVHATARLRTDSQDGPWYTTLPLTASSGSLRTSQSADFGGIEDAGSDAISQLRAGTFRTSFGLVESDGKDVTVRVTVHFTAGAATDRAVIRATASKDYALKPNGFALIPDLSRELLGTSRDQFQDLHAIEVDVVVLNGEGAVIPYVLSTENATGDVFVRTE